MHPRANTLRHVCAAMTNVQQYVLYGFFAATLSGCEPRPAAPASPAAATTPNTEQWQALRAGRDAVVPCSERFHEQGDTYAECVRYVADRSPASVQAWHRLGALYSAWVVADLVAQQQGDADAQAAALHLLHEAETLQKELHVDDAPLCRLVEKSCDWLAVRKREIGHGA